MSKKEQSQNDTLHNLRTFGSFTAPSYITLGDKYKQQTFAPTDSRYKGKQFGITPLKSGRTDKELLEKNYKPLAATTKYVNYEEYQRHQALEEKKKHPMKPFVPSSPAKHSEGKGSIYGAFNKPPEHKPDAPKEVKRDKDAKLPPRNIMTNPGKKGGYGYYHTTIGGKEYPYKEDPYGGVKKKKEEKKEKGNTKPFVSTSHGDRLFDPKSVYSMDGVKVRAAPKKAAPKKASGPAFKSMSAPKDTFNKFPEYKSPEPKQKTPRPKQQSDKKLWKPASGSNYPTPTTSIMMTGLSASTTFAHSHRG